ncbi:MAG: cyclic-di-AMP receptor [Anaerolineae bacterium]|jgi:uncharacterized protein YaaQ|nr:cyclic-di-AMP receptor [Anaerolineae bacterium]
MGVQVATSVRASDATSGIDRAAVVIVQRWQAQGLVDALTAHDYAVTVVKAAGGLLGQGVVTLVVGLASRRLPSFFSLVRDVCPGTTRYIPYDAEAEFPWHPECELVEVRTGGATAFIVPVERFVQL